MADEGVVDAPYDPTETPAAAEPTTPAFDEKYVEPFRGLLFIGALTREFTWLGHRFKIKTLTVEDMLTVGQMANAFADTLSEERAFTTALVAASLVSVDGEDLPLPLGTVTEDRRLRMRFDYIVKNWFQVTVDNLYWQYTALQAEVNTIVAALGEADGRAV